MIVQQRMRGTVKRILRLGAPLLAGNVSHYLMKLVDLAMLGRLGTTMLAAAGIGTPAAGILYTLAWPVALGVQALAGRRFGLESVIREKGEPEKTKLAAERTGWVLSNGVVAGWLSVSVALLLSLVGKPALDAVIESREIASLAWDYVGLLRWSTILLTVGLAHRGFFGAVNRTGVIMVATIGSNGANIFFNWIFIFGHFGLPAMGIRGAALGTLCAEALMTAVYILYGLSSKPMKKYKLLRFRHVERRVVRDIIRIMIPPAVQNAAALAIFLSYQAIVERIGTEVLAVTSLVFALFRINKTAVGGFAQGASIIVGNELGAGRPDRAEKALRAQEIIAFYIGLVIVFLLIIFPESVLMLFALEPTLLPLGISALHFFAGFFFVEVMGYSLEIAFNHNGWGNLVLLSKFSTNVLFILGATVLAVFVFHWGVYGAWSGFAVYQVAHASILAVGFFSGRWKTVEVE